MADNLTQVQRHRNMSAIRSKGTAPEMAVRQIVHALGYRYRLHRRDLPGAPDLAFTRLMKVINVHGCFWHMHDCRYGCVVPKTNAEYWRRKREGNVAGDQRNIAELGRIGWNVMTIWECETREPLRVAGRIRRFLAQQTA